jgi:zona occludens toxin (predicted ATPase)
MIIGFAGTPGSGKTYEAVKKILDNLRMGRVVYTNIDGIFDPECQETIKSVCGLSDLALFRQLRPIVSPDSEEDPILNFWMHVEPGSLIVLDEIHKWFSNRDWQKEHNKQFGYWASTHRHNGFDVLLITQSMERIDAAVRSLLEWTYVFRKVNFFGSAVKHKYMCYSYGGEDTAGTPLAQDTRTYNALVFACYKSYVAKDIKELGVMKHVNVLNHWVFYAIPIVLCFIVYMVFFKSSIGTGDLFGSKKAMAAAEQVKDKKNLPLGKATAPDQPGSKISASIAPINRDGQTVYTNRKGTP